jgi:hypothetical protein
MRTGQSTKLLSDRKGGGSEKERNQLSHQRRNRFTQDDLLWFIEVNHIEYPASYIEKGKPNIFDFLE